MIDEQLSTEKNIALNIENLSFSYSGKETTISNLNLQVKNGSFTTLLGPSGCGKTTLLKLVSGFLQPSAGRILIDGISQNGIEPDKRKIGMVFQDYALFPHMTVRKNVLYGLKINNSEKLTKQELNHKVFSTLSSLDLQNFADRYPNELSGGQQQRVALARALVLNPKILLMDEPLSSLDTKLREKVREELKEIQQKLKITTIYVTHDQEEALSLSDQIAVMNDGCILQTDSPRNIYFKPADLFTADFIGRANFLEINDERYLVRPQWFELNRSDEIGEINGTVLSSDFLGDKTRFTVETTMHKNITVDLPTLETNFLENGRAVSLNITHKWKMQPESKN